MRFTSKLLMVVGLLSIGLLSASTRANDVLAGKFTLAHAISWNNTVLPAGDYTFQVKRTESNSDMLLVRGVSQQLLVVLDGQSACDTCHAGVINLAVQGDDRVVTALQLPGFYKNFQPRQSRKEKEARPVEAASAEQVTLQFGSK
jgi:hypothetical protein